MSFPLTHFGDGSHQFSGDSIDYLCDSQTATPKKAVTIDYSKYKTKMCRNFLMGIPCPFEDRCAFAHGDTQVRSPSATNNTPADLPPPPYASFVSSDLESPEDSRPCTPPAYPSRFRYEPYSHTGIIFAN